MNVPQKKAVIILRGHKKKESLVLQYFAVVLAQFSKLFVQNSQTDLLNSRL